MMKSEEPHNWNFSGTELLDYRNALENSANFGINGIIETSISTVSLDVVDSASLSNLDGFISTWWSDGATSSNSINDIQNFFFNGGDLLLLQDDTSHDAIGESLGIPTIGTSSSTISNGNSPLFDGPFGLASNIENSGAYGQLSASDILANNGTIAGTNSNGEITAAYWDSGDYIEGAGKMVIITDVDYFTSNFGVASYNPLNDNGIFALNTTAFLVEEQVPEPSIIIGTLTVLGFGTLLKRKNICT